MSQNQRAHFPENAIVAHLREIQRINAENGRPAGRSYAGGTPINVGVPTRVSSAAMQGEIVAPIPLSPEEVAERDALARKLGILPPSEDDNERYPDLESALAEGESVKKPAPEPAPDAMAARRASVEQPVEVPYRTGMDRLPQSRARLIDFRRIQSINLERGVAIVDDFEIDMPPADLRAIKKHVLELAVDYVTRQLALALSEVMDGREEGETLSEVRVDGHQPGNGKAEKLDLSNVSPAEGISVAEGASRGAETKDAEEPPETV